MFGRAGITSSTKDIVFETIEEILSAASSAESEFFTAFIYLVWIASLLLLKSL